MIVATLTLTLLTLPAQTERSGIPWRSDLDRARAEAAQKGLPLLIVFR